MGFALFAAGIALVVAPEYSPRARSLAGVLARFTGIQSGVLVLGGLVFFSLGILGRGIARLNAAPRFTSDRPNREDTGDVSRAVERLAGDMAQLRTTVQQVSSDVEKSSETLQRVLQAQEALGQLQGQPRDEGHDQPLDDDPLFRLAGSLDHMNARLDERLNGLTARLDERLAGLHELLEAGEDDPDDSLAASDAGGAGQLEVLVDLEDDPGATRPSEFFDGVEGLAAPEEQAPARESDSPEQRETEG